ncbi:putative hydroxypyruvate isomerase isoform X2 [Zootermopsis nevadensis]|uniref:Putative hydroxypyruvate isomerase n=1 Tax=Zootermopsis nevadensis TaxID=136037 RepID=A0A067R4J4_ZOONE|nr:putative hydroxypyruvate isomerase isoform X2 [Zootermopsis nevadensis]KDR18001.1 Putative hydroxypyruvate isomerase [Zootermopsis nevadensis]
MPLKFCANLSFMFQETASLLERYQLARDVGFRAVECAFPYVHTVDEVVAAQKKANVEQILINVFVGDVTKGELGFAAIPGAEQKFNDSVNLAIKYAKALKCSSIHVMSGAVEKVDEENVKTYEKNIKHAASLFEKENILGLIEPINPYSVPNYYMNSFHKGLEVVKKVNSSNLKLMLDIFHLQQLHGNLTHNIKELLPYVGHIQIAQVPDRNEPNTSGEIDYRYVFSLLEKLGYDGWIGLEYKPAGNTEEGLKWVQEFNMRL